MVCLGECDRSEVKVGRAAAGRQRTDQWPSTCVSCSDGVSAIVKVHV